MKPKEALIQRAIDNGTIERLNILLSAGQILNCTANQYIEEAADLMSQNGLLLGRIKQLYNNFIRSADQYFREFASMIFNEKSKMDMFSDMDSFDKVFREWSKIDREWKPKQLEEETNEE